MRVIAGTARRLPLKTPDGMDVRPTTDRIKETLFNMLQSDIPGTVFIDLFSGSGAIGIEALSRGARRAYFVETANKALYCIRQNLTFTKLEDRAIVIRQEACSALRGINEDAVDIIFMDPPYDCGHEQNVLAVLQYMPYVTKDTRIIIEASLYTDFSWLKDTAFTLVKEKRYKTNKHIFCRLEPSLAHK